MSEVLYRYEPLAFTEGFLDEHDQWHTTGAGTVELRLVPYPVLRHSPRGAWISVSLYPREDKFILRDAYKHWACETKEQALESFIRRKRRQLAFPQRQTKESEAALRLAQWGETRGRVDSDLVENTPLEWTPVTLAEA